MKFKRIATTGALAVALLMGTAMTASAGDSAGQQAVSRQIPGGSLTSNSWHGNKITSGSTYQWDYQVSAVYSGTNAVSKIRTTWTANASLRNGASFDIGVSKGEISVGYSSTWQSAPYTAYWENSNGAKSASWRSRAIVTPSADYRLGTFSIRNTARVYVSGNAQPYDIASGY